MRKIAVKNAKWGKLQPEAQKKIEAIVQHKDIIKLTYDRVFRAIFDPDIHRDRLERFLTQLMGQEIKIVESVPVEGNNRTVDAKRIYLDILVKFEDGSLANIEMQRMGKLFPNTRSAVYSSDLIIRQYTKAKNDINVKKEKAKNDDLLEQDDEEIDYSVIRKVYTIVIIENSPEEFEKCKDAYLHHGKVKFDTKLNMDMMQEYIFVNLDCYSELVPEPETELEAWLAYLNGDTYEEIRQIIEKFPYFQNLLDDVILYVQNEPEEVQRAMLEYSVEMDDNGFKNQYRVKKKEVERLQQELKESEEKNKDTQAEAEKSRQEAEKSRQEAEESKQEAEKLKQEAEKSKEEADEARARIAALEEKIKQLENR